MRANGYATNLASEFYVLSVLYRLGFDASLTLGNKKAVDIAVVLAEGRAITIDVKANAGRNDWLIGDGEFHDSSNHFFVLVSYEGQFESMDSLPRCWIFPSSELRALVKTAGNQKTKYIGRRSVLDLASDYEGAWSRLRPQ